MALEFVDVDFICVHVCFHFAQIQELPSNLAATENIQCYKWYLSMQTGLLEEH